MLPKADSYHHHPWGGESSMAVDEHVICKAHLACMRCFRLFALIVASALGLYHASLAGPPSEEGFGGYVQLRLSDFEGGGSYISLRRSKIWFRRTGRKSGYYFQMLFKSGNRSKTDERIYLQVARFWFKTRTGVLMLGQFKPPFSIERFTWDGALKTINRACATKSLIPYGKMGPALVRDYGIQWEGWGRDKRLRYAIACFVGNGANRKFRGNGPLLCLRLRWTPISKKRPLKRIKFLRLETAFAWRRNRDQNFASALPGTRALGYNHFSGYDMRWTVGFGVDPGRASFRGEYYWAYFSS
ncbi:MAG TPA: hypothetical protein EYP10_13370, partial [Armatimonadetes bacterium]|nr:hypothetical protein [Armatimonadota bacterium]